jgi:hypothetical protein
MAELPLFQQFQIQFTARLRNPQQPVPAGVDADRAEIYTELLFNNLRGFIDACCPISREITGELRWTELIRSFYIEYRCHSPLFRDIPREFVHWLRTQPVPLLQLPPFIADLAHYEWLELAADVHPAHVVRRGPVADVYGAPLSVNPTLQLGIYPWPVQQICSTFQPLTPDSTPSCLAVHRDDSDTVRFTQLNPLSAHLLGLLQMQPGTGDMLLTQLSSDAGIPLTQLHPFAAPLLQHWLAEQLIL